MKIVWISIGVCVVLMAIYIFVITRSHKKITEKLLLDIANNKQDDFNKLMKKNTTGFFVKPFELYRLNLLNAVKNKTKKDIDDAYDAFNQLNMNVNQKVNIYTDAFYYYLSNNNITKCKEYYELLSYIDSYPNKFNIDCSYNTFIENGYKYLNEALDKLNLCKANEKPMLLSLISTMYKNKNDKDNEAKYQKMASDLLKK